MKKLLYIGLSALLITMCACLLPWHSARAQSDDLSRALCNTLSFVDFMESHDSLKYVAGCDFSQMAVDSSCEKYCLFNELYRLYHQILSTGGSHYRLYDSTTWCEKWDGNNYHGWTEYVGIFTEERSTSYIPGAVKETHTKTGCIGEGLREQDINMLIGALDEISDGWYFTDYAIDITYRPDGTIAVINVSSSY